MATYAEIFDIRSNSNFRNKIAVAIVVKATALLNLATPSSNQVSWANSALDSSLATADKLMNYVLAENKSATTGQIVGADDATIQTNVDAAVDKLIAGGIVS